MCLPDTALILARGRTAFLERRIHLMIGVSSRTKMCMRMPGIMCGNGDKEIGLTNWQMLITRLALFARYMELLDFEFLGRIC